jgi:thioredoxin-like negative regulator of GroEL
MFWKKKKSKKSDKPTREDIIKQATQSLQEKREEVGDETLQSIRQAIAQKENSVLGKAKRQIESEDVDKVLDNLSLWLKDKE